MVQYGVAVLDKGIAIACDLRLVLNHLWISLRARREAVIYGLRSLAKGITIYCETCLVANGFSSRLIVK
ncbi:MAG TPA: hypothetical protein ENI67_07895 [Gammaproteobacteria bacterium]|nr:hypothetical protein [Gammaproteobacteria bacterium]